MNRNNQIFSPQFPFPGSNPGKGEADRELLFSEYMKNDMEENKKVFQELIRYWPVFVGIVLIIIGLGIIQVLRSNIEPDDMSGINTSTIITGDIRLSAYGSGVLIAADEVQVGFEYGGIVEGILVEVGDTVKQGDILVELYDEELQEKLADKQAALGELTSDASVATAALALAEAQMDVLTAESTLSFYLSPYVYKAEIRLQEAQDELMNTVKEAEENSSEEAVQRVVEAQAIVDHAELSLALNWETYYEEYVPDFFNFRWRDLWGFWHDYYDPPSELEVGVVWAELASSKARVQEAKAYLVALTEGVIPEYASGTQLTALEKAGEAVIDAREKLEESRLTAPIDGIVLNLDLQVFDKVNTNPVLTIVQLEPITIEVSFDEGDWSLVKVGNPVEVIFDSLSEKTYSGQIVFVDPSLQTDLKSLTVNALVELDISNAGWANLPLGSAASVEVIAGEIKNAVLLPVEALQKDQGKNGVVMILENDNVIEQAVELGLRDVIYVEVTGGLSVGDVVVIGKLDHLLTKDENYVK